MATETRTEHTPGPWAYEYGAVYAGDVKIGGADRDETTTRPVERDANARIMGAGLALLEAAETLEGRIDHMEDCAQRLHAASGCSCAVGDLAAAIDKARA